MPGHIANGDIHVTAGQKAAWNGKAAGTHASQHASGGSDPITPAAIGAIATAEKGQAGGVASLDENGKVPEAQIPSMGFQPQIVVTAPTGSTVTATQGSKVYTASESSGTWTFKVEDYGTYTITATKGTLTATGEVIVEAVQQYAVELKYIGIYGVQWDGTSTTALTRTDAAAGFTDPVPYVAGATSYGSPFDDIQPWAGMVRVTDSEADELVVIPKFWYKWTKSGNTLKLQISNCAQDGFFVSPAHADRGDGKGERDVVYVGRYHSCSTYKSTTGQAPKGLITRSTARTNIHNLGATIWQFDYAMRLTIQMLYLVEFADWNSQAKIGYGCGNNSKAQNVGASDSMPYHTGTMQSSRTTYGVGVQYRNIEGLWDNVYDWMDGCYYSSAGLSIILNPSNFSDTANGTVIGTPSSGYPKVMSVAETGGVQWMYPTKAGGSDTTYIPDYWYFGDSYPCLCCGSSYGQVLSQGLFRVDSYSTQNAGAEFGCRLQKLP